MSSATPPDCGPGARDTVYLVPTLLRGNEVKVAPLSRYERVEVRAEARREGQMLQLAPDSPKNPASPPKRLQFTLRFLLFFTAMSALFLGICQTLKLQFGLAIFAICFFAFMMLVLGLMMISRNHYAVVFQASSETEAILCQNHLQEHGITAVVIGGSVPGFSGLATRVSQVVVAQDQADRARQLLAELVPKAPGQDAEHPEV
jgi:hypothetical protein